MRGEAEFPGVAGLPPDLITVVGRKAAAYGFYVEDLKRGNNKDIEPKDIFERASNRGGAKCLNTFF